jgi:hypothetical protein
LINIEVSDNETVRKELINESENLKKQLSLNNLSIGNFKNSNEDIDSAIIEILVLTNISSLKSLSMIDMKLKNSLKLFSDKLFKKFGN